MDFSLFTVVVLSNALNFLERRKEREKEAASCSSPGGGGGRAAGCLASIDKIGRPRGCRHSLQLLRVLLPVLFEAAAAACFHEKVAGGHAAVGRLTAAPERERLRHCQSVSPLWSRGRPPQPLPGPPPGPPSGQPPCTKTCSFLVISIASCRRKAKNASFDTLALKPTA